MYGHAPMCGHAPMYAHMYDRALEYGVVAQRAHGHITDTCPCPSAIRHRLTTALTSWMAGWSLTWAAE
eukprot:362608-Chlamydomonas_euryale.AAC.1